MSPLSVTRLAAAALLACCPALVAGAVEEPLPEPPAAGVHYAIKLDDAGGAKVPVTLHLRWADGRIIESWAIVRRRQRIRVDASQLWSDAVCIGGKASMRIDGKLHQYTLGARIQGDRIRGKAYVTIDGWTRVEHPPLHIRVGFAARSGGRMSIGTWIERDIILGGEVIGDIKGQVLDAT